MKKLLALFFIGGMFAFVTLQTVENQGTGKVYSTSQQQVKAATYNQLATDTLSQSSPSFSVGP